jgi:translocation and assembly module TamB
VTQSAGTLGLDLHLTGTPQQPRVQGLLSLRDGVLQLAATGERYRDIQARLQFAGDHLEIEQLQVGSRSGTLQLSGQVAHAGLTLRQIDLALRAQDFTAMSTPGIEAVLSADIRARGPQDALLVSGKLNVPRARLVTNKLPGGGPKAVEPWELTVPGVYGRRKKDGTTPDGAAAVQVGADGILSALRADIAIDMPQNVWVQGPGTAVEMSGELRVSKERQAPFIISGTVQTIRGFASFYGKKFELTQGQVTFTGAPEINPQLDVTVTRKVSDYVVTIHAGGKAQQPEIMLSSTPPLDQMDIVSLLVVGKTTDKLTSSEQTSFSKQAQQLVGGAVASQLEGVVGETLGLDTIELTTDSAKVGRYVTQDLFLSYERGLADKETGNVVGAEYSINRRVKLKGTSSDKGETALDLLWRLDY